MNEQTSSDLHQAPVASTYAAGPVPAMAPSGGLQPMLGPAPLGKIRSTGTCILLTVVTFGIYSLYWYFKVHDEMKRHSGAGLGGGLALVLGLFVGIAMISSFVAPASACGT